MPSSALGYQGILYNIGNGEAAKGPFGANAKLRQALNLAIDRDAVNLVVRHRAVSGEGSRLVSYCL